MAALFACTKCHRRFPFDDLSRGDQLCKDCKSNCPVVKCTCCREEFQLSSKSSTTTICAKCAENAKVYGKPKACEYCSIKAAFIGKRCQRCVNSEKKWGPPLSCERCNLKCAFDRSDDAKRKVDGKQLCWLCTQAYRRVLAKTKNTQDFAISLVMKSASSGSLNDSAGSDSLEHRISRLTSGGGGGDGQGGLAAAIMRLASSNTNPSASASTRGADSHAQATVSRPAGDKASAPNGHRHHHHHHHRHHHHHKHSRSSSLTEKTVSLGSGGGLNDKRDLLVSGEGGKEESTDKKHHRSRSHHGHHHHSKHHTSKHPHPQHKEETDEPSPAKNPKLDKVSNGVAVSTPKSTGSNVSDNGPMDSNSSENVILITQLREQIESLKKQLQGKDAQMLEKDKKINELKAENYEAEKDARARNQTLQKLHEEAISNMQGKNRDLQRQVTKLSKGVKKSVLESISSSN